MLTKKKNKVMLLTAAVILFSHTVSADDITTEMVLIPAGSFIMGSNKVEESNKKGEFGNNKPWYMDEHPQHKETLPAYHIDKYEVTNGEYKSFVASVHVVPPEHWLDTGYIVALKLNKVKTADTKVLRRVISKVFKLDVDVRMLKREKLLALIDRRLEAIALLPVTHVSWGEANAFCNHVGKRLPTEKEWEKAARGPDGQEFPWGAEWEKAMSNTGVESWKDGVAPVGSYEGDRSPYGVFDLAGNVTEWVADWYEAYSESDYDSKLFGHTSRVGRGAAWGGSGHYALHLFQRGAYRHNLDPAMTYNDVGFRCASNPEDQQVGQSPLTAPFEQTTPAG